MPGWDQPRNTTFSNRGVRQNKAPISQPAGFFSVEIKQKSILQCARDTSYLFRRRKTSKAEAPVNIRDRLPGGQKSRGNIVGVCSIPNLVRAAVGRSTSFRNMAVGRKVNRRDSRRILAHINTVSRVKVGRAHSFNAFPSAEGCGTKMPAKDTPERRKDDACLRRLMHRVIGTAKVHVVQARLEHVSSIVNVTRA